MTHVRRRLAVVLVFAALLHAMLASLEVWLKRASDPFIIPPEQQ